MGQGRLALTGPGEGSRRCRESYQHVEGQVAARLRREGIRVADLVINNVVCGAEPLPDAGSVAEMFDANQVGFAGHDARAFAYFIAPDDNEAVLRADIDFDHGRAALRWLPTAPTQSKPDRPDRLDQFRCGSNIAA